MNSRRFESFLWASAIFMLFGLLITAVVYAGDKEDFQAKLDKLIQQKTMSSLALENSQLKAQLAKGEDDKVNASLGELVKQIQDKGFIISQLQDGTYKVEVKPPEVKPEEKPKTGEKANPEGKK